MPESLDVSLHKTSPRYFHPKIYPLSILIHLSVAGLWLFLVLHAFFGRGLSVWSIGITYITYDTLLIGFTFLKTLPLRSKQIDIKPSSQRPTLTVVIAAFNEALVLENAIRSLQNQSEVAEEIIIADDGSNDATAQILQKTFNITPPDMGAISPPARLRWLRGHHVGKAATLNCAIPHIQTDLIVTVDADTVLDSGALRAMRDGFQSNPDIVIATGVLSPFCNKGFSAAIFEWFQTYEYIRNFLGRYAWNTLHSLLLVSGAFAGFRRKALLEVGGFDPDCLVEDYELTHRMLRYSYNHHLSWRSSVFGSAHAKTSAPETIMGFLRQRRRWFAGFLQTHKWYSDMVGAQKYGHLGSVMLPVKAIDTLQPIYGLCAFLLLIWYILTRKFRLLIPIGTLITIKIIIDLMFHVWSVETYRRWVHQNTKISLTQAILASIAEPFSFQLLRHIGACMGWVAFLTGRQSWEAQKRGMPKS